MKVKVSSIETIQIARALKSGWLDLDKIESLKNLADGYNPPKTIKAAEHRFYLDALREGWGYVPTDEASVRETMQGLESDLLKKWEKQIDSGNLYRLMVKTAFIGLVAVRALGGSFIDVDADFNFTEEKPPRV